MKKKVLFVENPYYICNENNAIVFKDNDNEETRISFEDISGCVIDNDKCTISTSLISKLSDKNIVLIINDNKHMPISIVESINHAHNASERVKLQISNYNKQDNLWRRIVKQKLKNSSDVLKQLGHKNKSDKIEKLRREIKRGDNIDLIEALCAKEFFSIYDKDYSRFNMHHINAFQNYGYAVIRSAIVQQLIIAGLSPQIGIHHKSNKNINNLADDLIEIYRPYIDYKINIKLLKYNNLDSEAKKELIKILDDSVYLSLRLTTIQNSIKILVYEYIEYLEGQRSIKDVEFVEYDF